MKAISVKPPWGELIINHGKDLENRSWKTTYRGWVLVHSTKSTTADYDCEKYKHPFFQEDILSVMENRCSHQRGGIIGAVKILDVKPGNDTSLLSRSRWAESGAAFHWELKDAIALPFVPWKGRQRLFRVDIESVFEVVYSRYNRSGSEETQSVLEWRNFCEMVSWND